MKWEMNKCSCSGRFGRDYCENRGRSQGWKWELQVIQLFYLLKYYISLNECLFYFKSSLIVILIDCNCRKMVMETIENIITLQVCLRFTCFIYPEHFHRRMIDSGTYLLILNRISSGHIGHWFEVGGAAHWRHPLCFPGTDTGLNIDFPCR